MLSRCAGADKARRSWRRTARDALSARARDNGGMEISVNGESRTVADRTRIVDLLQAEGLGERRVAVEVNGAIVARSAHATHGLQPGDRVEIVHALGGG
jgi:sulfur carrier protein